MISIITPNLNNGDTIEETIKSVINQDYRDIEYIIVDGGSNDNSKEIILKYEKYISQIFFIQDNGMYDAIHFGFKKAKGDFLMWLNSDDLLVKNSISKIMTYIKKKKYSWVNGINGVKEDNKIRFLPFPYFYPQRIIQKGLCHKSSYGFIPQESVVFSKNLYFESGGLQTDLQYAGDYFLWKSFANFEKLRPVPIKLGVFRKRLGQKSENLDAYYKEIKNKYLKKKINFFRLIISFFYSFFLKKK